MVTALAEQLIDLVLLLSPWPETFSFVTYEAFAAGADVIALAAAGNAADAVRHQQRGVVMADDSALFDFFLDGGALEYCRLRDAAGRRPGRLLITGTTAMFDPTSAGGTEIKRFPCATGK